MRLYTGPMYVHYNGVLRNRTQGSYVTTIHAINSAIVRLGKLQKPSVVYRGVSGGVLPSSFFTPDEYGVMGGVETSFMSTSLDRRIAEKFANRSTDKHKCAMLFHIQMGMVDRGASVGEFSQFPREAEILFAPLTGLEVVSKPWIEGRTIVVDLRLSTNTKDLTIEEVPTTPSIPAICVVAHQPRLA